MTSKCGKHTLIIPLKQGVAPYRQTLLQKTAHIVPTPPYGTHTGTKPSRFFRIPEELVATLQVPSIWLLIET